MEKLKRGDTVYILRPTSYWYKQPGIITSIEGSERYGISCRFSNCNYQGNFVAKFKESELKINLIT